MRIAWVSFDFEEYTACHVNALCQEHDVLLVLPEQTGSSQSHPIDIAVEHYEFHKPRFRQPLKQWMAARKILARIHEFQPDVVHLQQGHMWFNFALNALRRYPLVVTIHNPRHHAGDAASRKTPQWIFNHGFRKADHVIVHGEALADEVRELFGFPNQSIHVAPHVAMGNVNPSPEVEQDAQLILFFGRIWDYKGLGHLIAAQPRISEALPDAKIMIAGEGEDFSKYQAMMKDPSKFIVHNRRVSDLDRANYFHRASIVVLPYNEATQTGVVPVAYNYGRPVIATRVGALPECIDDGITGLMIEPHDPDAIADAVIDLLREPNRVRQMGLAAKAKLDRECSPQAVAKQTVAVYQTAIDDRTKNRSAASSSLENSAGNQFNKEIDAEVEPVANDGVSKEVSRCES